MPTISVDWSWFNQFLQMPPLELAWTIFKYGGFVPIVLIAWSIFKGFWLVSRQIKYAKSISFVMLTVDVPRLNEQTPKAVEHIFTHLAGAHSTPTLKEKWWLGKFGQPFSFELVCIEGYIRFIIRTPVPMRDLIEAAIFSQYPEAEITEIADYADAVPGQFPNPEWDCWGTEFTLAKPSAYPLRTWDEFEHELSGEFKDPLSSMLEAMARLKKGEQVWLQILLWTNNQSWVKEAMDVVKKLTGKEAKRSEPLVVKVANEVGDLGIRVVRDMTTWGPPVEEEKKKDEKEKKSDMSSGERKVVEAIEHKITKTGFDCKFRMIYVGRRNSFRKGPVISMIRGALGLFGSLNANAFKPLAQVTPKTDYFWQTWSANTKKNAIMAAYRERSPIGGDPFILNVEELASLWHFPQVFVKAPLIKKVDSKKVEPPFSLPTA